MEIGDWSACPDLVDVYRDIRELGLERNLAELEAFGYTVVEEALTPDQTTAMRDRIVELSESAWASRWTWRPRPSTATPSTPTTSSSRTRCSRPRWSIPKPWR